VQTPAPPRIPRATYRLQFHAEFTFRQATAIVDYLDALGISHIYASPYFTADKASTHGYDVADHRRINREIGSADDFGAFTHALALRGMGQVLDFVPNHMGIGPMNRWWMDVLENGPNSQHAAAFDIEWQPLKRGLENRLLLPILGNRYGKVLEEGQFSLLCDRGAFYVRYFETVLPLNPRTYPLILRKALEETDLSAESRAALEKITQGFLDLPTRHEVSDHARARRAEGSAAGKARLRNLMESDSRVATCIQATLERFAGKVGEPASFDDLDELLNGQVYRLSYWRVAAEQINYRRFFDVNSLAAIRTEVPEVFASVHELAFQMIEQGQVHGLRIDHIDGLWDPAGYLQKLQSRFSPDPADKQLYLVVEKILGAEEELPRNWPVHGTTGYEFAAEATAVQVDPSAERTFQEFYLRLADDTDFRELVYEKKLLVTRMSLASEVAMLAHLLERLAERDRNYRDFTLEQLTAGVRETLACFPVYRSYVAPDGSASEEDKRVVLQAIRSARRRNPEIDWPVFAFIGRMLLMELREDTSAEERRDHVQFAQKFQQCSGPVMAKGVEDTAFYIYNRLVALNEVGGAPDRFGLSVEAFHARCARRLATHPHTMLATSTHDTKRGEDVRARIAALSELPDAWVQNVRRWMKFNADKKTLVQDEMAPSANEEYLIYQTLVGSWPLKMGTADDQAEFVKRIQEYLRKALKEAKVNSSWIDPQEDWERATTDFIARILDPSQSKKFLRSFRLFVRRVAEIGMVNSLAQTVLKCTTPGVPDFYQGTELWNFTLVDPDNRRPVDYEVRRKLLEALPGRTPGDLYRNWGDGGIKMYVIQRLLQARRKHTALIDHGSYEPVPLGGLHAHRAIAFRRVHEGQSMAIIVPRLTETLGRPTGDVWRDTLVCLPAGQWRNVFTDEIVESNGGVLVSVALKEFPVACFVSDRGEQPGA
jgi:(1->4)-alpha-D-glucan 1-alpha-D-glucosylmutase